MHRVWLRASLVIAMLVVAALSGIRLLETEGLLDDERAAARHFAARAWALTVSLGELQAVQHAYLAAGQDREYWTTRGTTGLETVRTDLDELRGLGTDPSAARALEDAAAALDTLSRMDARAREHSTLGQDLLASDLIFTDELPLQLDMARLIEHAREAEQTGRAAVLSGRRQEQGLALAAAMGAAVLVVLLLLPLPKSPEPADRAEADAGAPGDADAAPEQDELPAGRLLLTPRASPRPGTPASEPPDPAATGDPDAPALDLRAAATLCTDLGRLSDTADLPALLARAASLLNARGIIVWIRDGSGTRLRPAIAHGYTRSALARLGTLDRDGDNATATAFRDGRMQVVAAATDSGGAVVAPLLAPSGTAGAVSVELHEGGEGNADLQSTATIIAAQLGTLVTADPPAGNQTTEPAAQAGA